MRTWIRLALAVLLTTPFMLTPLHAADPEETTSQKIQRMQKDLDALRKEVEQMKRDLTDNNLRAARAAEDIGVIKELLLRIARNQDDMRTQETRTSANYPPNPSPPNGGTGTVYLRNDYPATATIRINNQTYTVPANRTLTVTNVPLGTITYEISVDGYGVIQPSSSVPLSARGRNITVFPIPTE